MVQSLDGNGVLLIGGKNKVHDYDQILELRAGANSWSNYGTLEKNRAWHTVIPFN